MEQKDLLRVLKELTLLYYQGELTEDEFNSTKELLLANLRSGGSGENLTLTALDLPGSIAYADPMPAGTQPSAPPTIPAPTIPEPPPDPVGSAMHDLHDLYEAGDLSEDEFQITTELLLSQVHSHDHIQLSLPPADPTLPRWSDVELSAYRAVKPGQTLLDRYQLESFLGQGSIGQVFLCYDLVRNGRYALKLIHPHLAHLEELRQRFVKELKSNEMLAHPGIVRTFNLEQDPATGVLFYTMEYVQGEPLDQIFQRAEQRGTTPLMPLDWSWQLLSELTLLLEYIHARGLVYRDLKPSNVMLTPEGHVKLMDFAVAELLEKTAVGPTLTQFSGLGYYMAPEQQRGRGHVQPAADVFSLGVLTYQLFTGELPIGRVEPPSQLWPRLDAFADNVIMRAMEPRPERRYERPRHFWHELSEVFHALWVHPPPARTSGWYPTLTPYPKNAFDSNASLEHMQPPSTPSMGQIGQEFPLGSVEVEPAPAVPPSSSLTPHTFLAVDESPSPGSMGLSPVEDPEEKTPTEQELPAFDSHRQMAPQWQDDEEGLRDEEGLHDEEEPTLSTSEIPDFIKDAPQTQEELPQTTESPVVQLPGEEPRRGLEAQEAKAVVKKPPKEPTTPSRPSGWFSPPAELLPAHKRGSKTPTSPVPLLPRGIRKTPTPPSLASLPGISAPSPSAPELPFAKARQDQKAYKSGENTLPPGLAPVEEDVPKVAVPAPADAVMEPPLPMVQPEPSLEELAPESPLEPPPAAEVSAEAPSKEEPIEPPAAVAEEPLEEPAGEPVSVQVERSLPGESLEKAELAEPPLPPLTLRSRPSYPKLFAVDRGPLDVEPPSHVRHAVLRSREGTPLLRLLEVKAGSFLMGSRGAIPLAYRCERPQRRVFLSTFWISQTPITNRVWQIFLDESGYTCDDRTYLRHWRQGEPPEDKLHHPVVYIDMFDLLAFCDFYGLEAPTEAQWEKAARGFDGQLWPWGDQKPHPKLCNFLSSKIGATTPVTAYPDGVSPFGLYDCSGNVWELCADNWDQLWLENMGEAPRDPFFQREGNPHFTVRGGYFSYHGRGLRCAFRFNTNKRDRHIGARVASAQPPG